MDQWWTSELHNWERVLCALVSIKTRYPFQGWFRKAKDSPLNGVGVLFANLAMDQMEPITDQTWANMGMLEVPW